MRLSENIKAMQTYLNRHWNNQQIAMWRTLFLLADTMEDENEELKKINRELTNRIILPNVRNYHHG